MKDPVGYVTREVDGAIPIADVYGPLSQAIKETRKGAAAGCLQRASGLGMGWARAGGENQAVALGRQISVDGLQGVIEVFEDIERGKLSNIDYVEALACTGGCVGGVLTVESPFIARRRIRILAEEAAEVEDEGESLERRAEAAVDELDDMVFRHETRIEPRTALALAGDMSEAIRRMERLDQIVAKLPGLDCGSCGAPTCQALAEDIVKEQAVETDCVFVLRQRVQELAQELGELASKLPPAMRGQQAGGEPGDPVLERLFAWPEE